MEEDVRSGRSAAVRTCVAPEEGALYEPLSLRRPAKVLGDGNDSDAQAYSVNVAQHLRGRGAGDGDEGLGDPRRGVLG